MARHIAESVGDDRVVVHHPAVDRERIRSLFDSQRDRQWTIAKTTATDRVAKLQRLRGAIVARSQELFDALHHDLRKSAVEVELTELQPVLAEIAHASKYLKRWMKPKRVGTPMTLAGTFSEVRYEPKGVCLILSPWNYPFSLTINPLTAAIAAGNCAIIKPSEKTPNVSSLLGRIIEDVFEPDEVVLLEGDAKTAEALLDLPFDHIFFTGSTRIGRIVMSAAAKHLASVTLELGGKSPVVVAEDADLEKAAKRIVWGKFINAGQTCVAPDYVFAPEAKAPALVEAMKRAVSRYYGESEEDRHRSPDFCRLVDNHSFHRISRLIDDSVAAGAKVEVGGHHHEDDRYVAPTILTNVDTTSPAMKDEIFGPVLPILTYRSLDEVVKYIRRGGKPLAMYVFSNDTATIESLIADTSAGGTAINNVVVHLANPNLPFGGIGESGLGSYHGEYGFRAFSHERAVLEQGRLHTFEFFYPPYTPRIRKMVRKMTDWLH